MKNNEYWTKRFELLQEKELANADRYIERLEKQYKRAYMNLEKQISSWYTRLATNNEVSLENARKILDANELEEFKWTLEDYIEKGRTNGITEEWAKQLENASARVHISKMQAMQTQIRAEIEDLYYKQNKDITTLEAELYGDTYYRSAYEIQKGNGIAWQVPALQKDAINKVISKPWTTDGKTFSDRVWSNKNELVYTLQTELTQALIRGDNPATLIDTVSKKFNVSRNKAGRLVMTESAFFSSAGQKKCFEDLNVEKYKIIATLDNRTSDICQEMDGKVFDMKDFEPGITAPPFHIYCRTCTAPYFADNYTERIARDENGNTYKVPGDITYKEWKEKYIQRKQNLKKELKDVKIKREVPNNTADFYKYTLDIDNKEDFVTTKSNENGYITGQRLNEILGYDDLPKQVSMEEFKTLSKESELGILYRGISADTAEKCQNYIDSFKNGKFYSGGQAGHIYGKGTYTGFGELGRQTANNYANGSKHGQVIEMVLDKSAKTIKYHDLFKEVNKEVDEFIKNNYKKYGIDNYMKLVTNLNKIEEQDEFMTKYILNVMHDVGYSASIKGYDAIVADNELAKQKYVVILNRSKVILHE